MWQVMILMRNNVYDEIINERSICINEEQK